MGKQYNKVQKRRRRKAYQVRRRERDVQAQKSGAKSAAS